jgi:Type II CAAX prenyl endopeptidase Rce1-like
LISGAAIGLLASTNEEFTFRLFAIPFFERLTRSRWVAVILPAFLWSFLHSNYPQEPAYIRGIEIGLFGIVAGLVMLRWGILATLIWHYTVDASLVGLFLIRSNNLYFKISGAVVAAAAVAPLLFSGISYLTRGRFESDEDLLNSKAPHVEVSLAEQPAPEAAAVAKHRYDALAPGMLAFLAVCVLACGLFLWRFKPASIGDYLKLSVNPKTVHARADEVMRRRGLDPNSYRSATIFANVTDPVTNEFLRERIGVARLNEIYDTQVPGAIWQVRYFRDGQPEEYSIKLKPDGSLFAVHHKIAEDAAGASLSKEEAIARAEKYLREDKQIDLGKWSLVESNSDKRPHRIDHLLTWQRNDPLDWSALPANGSDHAYVRIRLVVLGNEVGDYRQSYYPESRGDGGTFGTYIKIPDQWARKQGELTPLRLIFNYITPLLVLGGGGIVILIIFLKNLRSETARSVPWKRLSMWALWGLAAFYVSFLLGNRIATALNAYDTAIPLKTMYGILGISALLGGPFNFALLAVTFGIAWYFAQRAFGDENLPAWTAMPAAYSRDAFFIGLGGAAAILGLRTLLLTGSQYWPTTHRAVDASFGSNFDAVLPGAVIISGMVNHSLLFTGMIAVVASFLAGVVRSRPLRWLIFVLAALAMIGSNWGSPADLVKQWLAQLILLSVIVFGVRRVMRFNIFGCFLAIAMLTLAEPGAELLGQPDRFYSLNGYAVVAVMLALLLWPLAAWTMAPANSASAQAPGSN